MIGQLPHDLIKYILEDFVDIDARQLSKLDVAVCNHAVRGDLLTVMQRIRLQGFDVVDKFCPEFNWVLMRLIAVPCLKIGAYEICEMVRFLAKLLPQGTKLKVRHMCFHFLTSHQRRLAGLMVIPVALTDQIALLNHIDCSLVEGLSFDNWDISDEHLDIFTRFTCKLNTFSMTPTRGAREATAAAMHAFTFGPTLKVLRCPILDDQALLRLAEQCKGVTDLSLSCACVEDASSVEKLCLANADTLTSLQLDINGLAGESAVGMVLNIAKACKKLSEFDMKRDKRPDIGETVSAKCLCHILEHCPLLVQVVPFGCGTEIKFGESGLDISWFEDRGEETLTAICSHNTIPIQRLYISEMSQNSDAFIRMLADKHGATLQYFECSMAPASEASVQYFVSRCPNLETLEMHHWQTLSDAIVSQLHIYCPKLVGVAFFDCEDVTDAGMIAYLDGCVQLGRPLKFLSLRDCWQLTDITMITASLPELDLLVVERTHITNETLLMLILEGRLRVGKIWCSDNEWLAQELRDANFTPMPVF